MNRLYVQRRADRRSWSNQRHGNHLTHPKAAPTAEIGANTKCGGPPHPHYSLGGVIVNSTGKLTANYWLAEVSSPEADRSPVKAISASMI